MAVVTLRINNQRLMHAATSTPQYDTVMRRKCDEIKDEAIRVFRSREVKHNQWRTSETTPPKYVVAWEIRRLPNDTFALINTDRSAMWVEFGAHAGGETPVLGYRPLSTALDIVSNRQ